MLDKQAWKANGYFLGQNVTGCWAAGFRSGSIGSAVPGSSCGRFHRLVFSRSLSAAALVVKPVGLHLQRENKIKGGILSTQRM